MLSSMKTKGFTLVELVIIISILVLIIGFSASSFSLLNKSQALNKSADFVATVLRQARSLTLSSKNISQYGVHFDTNQIVLFQGSTYDPNASTNTVFPINYLVRISDVNLTGAGREVIFDRLTGDTPQTGSLVLRLISNSSSAVTINIYGTGLIEASPSSS